MKDRILFVMVVLCICATINSCRKPEKMIQKSGNLSAMADGSDHVFHISDETATTIPKTILGDAYTCPFRVDIMQQAWNNLSPNDISNFSLRITT
jgi:hypothetical protein